MHKTDPPQWGRVCQYVRDDPTQSPMLRAHVYKHIQTEEGLFLVSSFYLYLKIYFIISQFFYNRYTPLLRQKRNLLLHRDAQENCPSLAQRPLLGEAEARPWVGLTGGLGRAARDALSSPTPGGG